MVSFRDQMEPRRKFALLLLSLLLLLLLLSAPAPAAATALLCSDAEGARLLFRATCASDRACRFEVIDNARVGATEPWFELLGARIDDVLFNTTARAFFEPAAWLAGGEPYVAVGGALNCSALAANMSLAPPLAMRAAVATFVSYQSYVAEDGRCSDLNTVAVVGSGGELTCQCLPDRVCEPSGQRRVDVLVQFIIVLTIIAQVGAVLAVIVIPLRNITMDA